MSTNLNDSSNTVTGENTSHYQEEYTRLSSELDTIQEKISQSRPAAIRNTILSTGAAIVGTIVAYQTSDGGKDFNSIVPFSSAAIALIGAGAAYRFQRGINGPTDPEEERRMMLLQQEIYITMIKLNRKKSGKQ